MRGLPFGEKDECAPLCGEKGVRATSGQYKDGLSHVGAHRDHSRLRLSFWRIKRICGLTFGGKDECAPLCGGKDGRRLVTRTEINPACASPSGVSRASQYVSVSPSWSV
jgi:hypothetical protein